MAKIVEISDRIITTIGHPWQDTHKDPSAQYLSIETQLIDKYPDKIGNWTACHENSTFLMNPGPTAALKILCWKASLEASSHGVAVLRGHPANDELYTMQYVWTNDEYYASTLVGFDTVLTAARYAIRWMQEYPEGGPCPKFDRDQVLDPEDTPSLEELLREPDPDLDTTGILDNR